MQPDARPASSRDDEPTLVDSVVSYFDRLGVAGESRELSDLATRYVLWNEAHGLGWVATA